MKREKEEKKGFLSSHMIHFVHLPILWDPREVQKKKNLLQTQNDITLSRHNLAHCDRYLYTVKIMHDHDQQH